MVSQRHSTSLLTDENQLPLIPSASRKNSAPPDVDYLKTLPSFRRVVRYSISLADLEPKQVYEPMDMDKAIWSRIENGGMSFPADDILKLRSITGNCAPLLWLNHQEGIDIRNLPRLRDDKDRRIAELEAQLAQERHNAQVIAQFVKDNMR
jgi:hypothetical protein